MHAFRNEKIKTKAESKASRKEKETEVKSDLLNIYNFLTMSEYHFLLQSVRAEVHYQSV